MTLVPGGTPQVFITSQFFITPQVILLPPVSVTPGGAPNPGRHALLTIPAAAYRRSSGTGARPADRMTASPIRPEFGGASLIPPVSPSPLGRVEALDHAAATTPRKTPHKESLL